MSLQWVISTKDIFSLVEKATGLADIVVVSIFVNPAQFGPNEDYETYPRTLEQDLEKIKSFAVDNEILIWIPKEQDIYPEGFSTSVEVDSFRGILCDRNRPGHFNGVTTVVYLLFKVVSPHIALFGQKDYQQYCLISKMNQDLKLGIDLIMGEIVRDEDGLALSSRNQYLSPEERKEALRLPQSLNLLKNLLQNEGVERTLSEIETLKRRQEWEYLDLRSSRSLSETLLEDEDLILIGSIKVNQTRLLDNLLITIKEVNNV